jgi:hypothetical protein
LFDDAVGDDDGGGRRGLGCGHESFFIAPGAKPSG